MWVRGVPYDEFARLRLQAPVAWFPDEGSGYWSVHRYADIVAADLVRFAVEAERAGLDCVMVSEHIVVCPGWTITEMADEEMAAFGASRGGVGVGDAYSLVTSLVPQRRAAGADEVAAVVGWLLSDAASYVNGAVIPVDGSASAVDVGTLPFDPRVEVWRYDGS